MHGSLKTTRDRKTQTTDYTYDIHGRLKNKKIGNNEISYTYDGSGNQLTLTDSTGTTTRTYDELNRTLTKEVPDIGTSTYLYDLTEGIPVGYTKETTKDPKGNIVAKTYDKTGRLYQVITEEGPTTYAYYDNGNRKSIIYPNGIKEVYTYYKDNLLKTLTNKKADGSILDTYSYGYDAAHNQLTKQDAKGITEYTYDSLNRLATVQEPGGKKTSYTYDKAGNRLTETVGTQEAATAVTTYTYNEQNRLQSTITVQGNGVSEKLTYNYDDNGNMVSKFKVKLSLEDPNLQGSFELFKAGEKENSDISFYEYDVWNQLVKTTEGTNKISYGYNGEGYRVEKTINGETARYLYEYDKVILEVDGAGAETASNVYGLNLVSKTAEGETAYYLYNGHADVTSLIDETGNTVATYYYDAFGNITEKTGAVKNNITYAGYQYDEETDLYYLNARYYDAKIARFMTEDTYRGSAGDPLSLNLYSYVMNNPLTYWDPSGHVAVSWEGYIVDIDDGELNEYKSHGWSEYNGNAYTENMNNYANIAEMNVGAGKKANIKNGKGGSIGQVKTGENSSVTINNQGVIGVINTGTSSRTSITNNGMVYIFNTGAKSTNDVSNNGTFFVLNTGLGNATTLEGYSAVKITGGNGTIYNKQPTQETLQLSEYYQELGIKIIIKDGKAYYDYSEYIKRTMGIPTLPTDLDNNYSSSVKSIYQMTDEEYGQHYMDFSPAIQGSLDGQYNAFDVATAMGLIQWDKMAPEDVVVYLDAYATGVSMRDTTIMLWAILSEPVKTEPTEAPPEPAAGKNETGGICFTGETLIKVEDGHKQIQDIKVGDKVYAENVQTGEKGYKNVKQIFINDAYTLLHISVNDVVIKTTFPHPFYVVGKGWVEAKDLKVGDVLKLANGETTEVNSLSVEKLETPVKVYNFEVDDWHTYYVSGYDVLVHNTGSNPCTQGGPNGTFENAPYHGKTGNSVKSKAPSNGQGALDNSVSIGENTTRRVGVNNGEIVVLDETGNGVFHGHVRTWSDLTNQMKSALIKAGLVDRKGNIIK